MDKIANLNFDFNIENKKLPANIYALRVKNFDNNAIYDIVVKHNGYCPVINNERQQSNYNDYLSNLETEVINNFFKINKIKKPVNYSRLFEIMTNENSELYHFSRSVNI